MISFSLQGDSDAFGILLTEDEIFFSEYDRSQGFSVFGENF